MAIPYGQLLGEIKERIRSAQYAALRAVNRELVGLYWDIGRIIACRQREHSWGKSVVERLAADLREEFPGTQGFSARNIWYMREFYTTYSGNAKLQPLVAEIAWTHNLIILTRCSDIQEREFYVRSARKYGWSKNVLTHQIENKSYEKTLLSQTNFDKALPEKVKNKAKLAVKDDYLFDFLELGEEHSEKELEEAILRKVEKFLREMGGMFAFVGRQVRLEVEGEEFFLDLLLYHRSLRTLVAMELKVGKFVPEHVGKMQFYLAVLDERMRLEGENPPIGIILCKTKNKTIVEFALKESHKAIGVAAYRIVTRLPASLEGKMPDPSRIAQLLDEI